MAKSKRQGLSPKIRFEVFKRDSFTCQYCGLTPATGAVLECDHIKAVAEGGDDNILNLTTSCWTCNSGKGKRALSDNSVVVRQHRQLEEMEERRQQLEMMQAWRADLQAHKASEIDIVVDAIKVHSSEWVPNDLGRGDIRRWIKKFGATEVVAAADESFEMYFLDGSEADWGAAFKKISLVLSMRAKEKTDPHHRKLLYIRGILRNRFNDPYFECLDALRKIRDEPIDLDLMQEAAKKADDWEDYRSRLSRLASSRSVARMEADARAQREEWITSLGLLEDNTLGLMLYMSAEADILGCVVGMSLEPEYANPLRGLQAAGLIEPDATAGATDIFEVPPREDEILTCLMLRSHHPDNRKLFFNDLGGIRLASYYEPSAFGRVAGIYG